MGRFGVLATDVIAPGVVPSLDMPLNNWPFPFPRFTSSETYDNLTGPGSGRPAVFTPAELHKIFFRLRTIRVHGGLTFTRTYEPDPLGSYSHTVAFDFQIARFDPEPFFRPEHIMGLAQGMDGFNVPQETLQVLFSSFSGAIPNVDGVSFLAGLTCSPAILDADGIWPIMSFSAGYDRGVGTGYTYFTSTGSSASGVTGTFFGKPVEIRLQGSATTPTDEGSFFDSVGGAVAMEAGAYYECRDENGENPLYSETTGEPLVDPIPTGYA